MFKTLDDNTITANGAKGELSKDGKTLTITAKSGEIFEGRYDVTIDGVKDTNDKDVEKYEAKNLDFGKDEVAPVISGVEKVNASTAKVQFSEPLSDAGNWTFKDAEGKTVKVTKGTFNTGDSAVTLTIDADVKAGTQITATVLGAKDQAGNLLNPNPSEVKFTKGDKDGVAPTVTSITSQGLDKFEIKFSEEVQGLTVANISVGGTVLAAPNKVEQDKDDKTKYLVTVDGGLTAGLHKIEVKESAAGDKVTDLSGEELKDFSQLVEFKADKIAPNFVSSAVVIGEDATGKPVEKLVLTFDKEVVQPATFTATEATELNKDLVTTKGTLTAGQLTVNTKNKKQLEVELNSIKFTTAGAAADLAKDATYTVKFAKGDIEDTNANKSETFEITFKRGEDGTAVSKAPKVTEVVPGANNNEITVKFDKAVDGPTATNAANYSILGLVIEKATLNPVAADGTQSVTLTLKKGTNTLNGDRNITVKNVKAKGGEVMETVTKTITGLKENVAPTVSSAKFSGTDATGKVNEITITFSEAVSVSEDAFELFVGDGTTAVDLENAEIVSGSEADKVVITIPAADTLSVQDIAKTITIKLADLAVVKDIAGNELDFKSIKATN